ncbi:DUF5693 family protein [Aminivibrio sp.]|uniref:DUF5693 family protein n=1 Tax=Aminivibrio sp. TaxID=1872489 RepID=UPI001A3FF327|nr:DUF5693 family protein [Aminivibrio sp.]MBL3540173.1 hypothetical protein [Aminivibrio sp.]MDK2959401.1 hypothetical protein [Synergistaceae bacterium]
MKKKIFPPEGARVNLGLCVVIILFLLSAVALFPRMGAERASRSAGIILDFRDVASLAASSGRGTEEAWSEMARRGATGLMVSELTGARLSLGVLPLYYGPASGLPDGARKALAAPLSSTSLFFPKTFSAGRKALPYLAARFPGMRTAQADGGTAVLLPRTMEDLLQTGILPDMDGLLLAERLQIPVFYRVGPALPGDTVPSVAALDRILADFPSIRTLAPAGETALGFPDLRPLAGAVRKAGRSVAVVEFSRQLGASQLNRLAFPSLLPLHSVTHEELLSRNISRSALLERLLRAVKERSVRLLVFRPSAMESSADPYGTFLGELGDLAAGLSAHGIAVTWPEPFSPWRTGIIGAAALALAFVYSLLRYLQRFFLFSGDDARERSGRVSGKGALLLGGVVLVTAVAVRFVPPAAKIIGALAAVFVVTEASFLALDGWRRPWAGLVGSFLFAAAGGLAIAAFFSEPVYMLRLRAFSGVKATLFLPPLLVLLADLRRREHPESLGEIFRRPPLWGELFLIGILLAGTGLVLFRSDNVQFVPAFEVRMREFLERVLVARPRSKEIFLGYPALLFWYYVRKADLWPRYREVLRMATVLGFSSAVNSFCHFHTPLYFILFRQFNGLWTGVLVGMIGIVLLRFVVLPLWEKYGRMVTE